MELGPGGRWGPRARPRLASKVRLQWNAPRGQALLLYPEGALALNASARAILELCDGRRTVSDLVRELASRFDGAAGATAASDPRLSSGDATPPGGTSAAPVSPEERERVVERDLGPFLERLRRRGWLVDEANPSCS